MLVLEFFLRVLSFVGHNFEIDPNLLSYSFLEHGSDPPLLPAEAVKSLCLTLNGQLLIVNVCNEYKKLDLKEQRSVTCPFHPFVQKTGHANSCNGLDLAY